MKISQAIKQIHNVYAYEELNRIETN